MIGNLFGVRAVVFIWQFRPFLCDARAIYEMRSPGVTSLFSLYDGNDN